MKPSQGGKQQTRDELVAAGETGAIAAGALASVRHLKESRSSAIAIRSARPG